MAGAADFDELYRTARDRLAVQLTAITGDRGEAMDDVQEAFVRAWQRWDRVGGYDDPEAWVRRVAYHLAVGQWRRMRRIVLRWDVPRVAAPDGEDGAVLTVLACLRLPERQAMALRYVAGLSVAEIAAELGAPTGTVKSWLSRGRARLAVVLSEEDEVSHERN